MGRRFHGIAVPASTHSVLFPQAQQSYSQLEERRSTSAAVLIRQYMLARSHHAHGSKVLFVPASGATW